MDSREILPESSKNYLKQFLGENYELKKITRKDVNKRQEVINSNIIEIENSIENENKIENEVKENKNNENKEEKNITRESDENMNLELKVIINNKTYIAKLEDNETVKEFISILPKEFNMNELNGNEKYVYLDKSLPTNSSVPNRIEKGDIMLFGNNCLVIFYKSFETTYSYTKIGHIENLEDLGNNNVSALFNY